MRNLKSESKEHYKSYKAGKHWVFACITVMSLGLGLVGANETAQADTNNASEPETSVVKSVANEQKPAASDTVDDSESNGDSGVSGKVDGSANGTVGSDADKDVNQDSNSDINNDENKDNNTEDANKNVDQDKDVPKNVAGDKQDDPSKDVQNQEQPADDQQQPGNQQQPEQTVPENKVEQKSPEVPVDENSNGGKQEDVSNLGKVKPMAESYSLLRDEAPSIDGIDASVWMPDANLRAWVEAALSKANRTTVDDSNLSGYVQRTTSIYPDSSKTFADIQSLEGLQYFTNLTSFTYYGYVPASGMIDFSFAPNLNSLTLNNKGTATGTMDATTFINLLANNQKLQWLNVTNYGLTGQFPDLSGFTDLKNLQMGHNQLTGAIPSLTTMPKVTYLYLGYNNLTDIPDMSGYTGSYDFSHNHLVTGIQKNMGISGNSMDQTVTGKDYTITPTVRSFDPITDVIKGVQDENGQLDLTDPMVAYNLGTPGDLYFTVEADSDNPIGFNIVAAEGTPDGTYTIEVFNQKTEHYNFDLTFTVTNAKDPVVDPGTGTTNPGTGTTNPGTGTTNPDTNTNPGTGTSTVTPGTDTTTTPDVTVDNGGDADQGVTDTNPAATNTPQTGGDAATIDTTTAAKAKPVAKAGQADQLVAKPSRQSAKSVTESKGQATKVVAPKALAASNQQQVAATTNQTKTTLPQTNERSGASLLAAGVALIIATFGMGLTAKHHE